VVTTHRKETGLSSQNSAKAFGRMGSQILCGLQWLFYAGFIFLWFKDNIFSLKKLHISPMVPLLPLIGIVGVRAARRIREKKFSWRPKFGSAALALTALLLLTIVVRLPFLLHASGMMTSDDAIPALMGKHISEGQLPPICYYGQQYLGSLSSHVYALFFWLFGYSMLTLKAATLLMYLAFVVVQFLLFRAVFSLRWAVILSLCYGLPFGQLVFVSLDNASAFPLVLFLGAQLIYVTYQIAYKSRDFLIPLLGFLMGLSFWTHQITAAFILTSLILLAIKLGPRLKTYGTLIIYAFLGGLPLVLQEIFGRFQMATFLFGGGRTILNREKWKGAGKLFRSLLFSGKGPPGIFFLAFILLGMAVLFVLALKKRGSPAQAVFPLFLIVFSVIYIFSRFSDKPTIRYLFLLYFCLPVFLAAPFLWIKNRLKFVLSLSLIAGLFFADGRTAYATFYESVKYRHRLYQEMTANIAETGVRYWQGEYWTAYLLTAIGQEKIIIDSFSTNRYLPYRLLYYNQQHKDHYILNTEGGRAGNLEQMLTRLGIPFDKKVTGDCTLLYNIDGPVFPDVLDEMVPSQIPDLSLDQIKRQNGYLQLAFINRHNQEPSSFRLNVEVPGYSSRTRVFSGTDEKIPLRIPYPAEGPFTIRYFLDYKSLKIASSARVLPYVPSGGELPPRTEAVVFWRGISPVIHSAGKDVRYCDQEAVFEVNAPPGKTAKLSLVLNSPFQFSGLTWYGNYVQHVQILLPAGAVVERDLHDGPNTIELEIRGAEVPPGPRLITMRFRYRCVFDFADLRTLSAVLENVEVIE
jgi:hypothetical protein